METRLSVRQQRAGWYAAGLTLATILMASAGPVRAVTQPVTPAATATSQEQRLVTCLGNGTASFYASRFAIGVPHLSPGRVDPGAGVGASFSPLSGPTGSGFGTSVASAFLDADLCADLVVGEPTAPGGGAVGIYYYDSGALDFSSAASLTLHAKHSGDSFGRAVAVATRPAGIPEPSVADIWVGAPGRSVAGKPGSGAVDHYVRAPDGPIRLVETITLADFGGAFAVHKARAAFGSVLSASAGGVLVGAPDQTVSGRSKAGAVYWLGIDASGKTVVKQAVGGKQTKGRLGAALSVDLNDEWALAGAPGWHSSRGEVRSFAIQDGRLKASKTIGQDSPGIPGKGEAGDRFGAAVVAGAGHVGPCLDAWMIGAPGEDVGKVKNAGSVTVIPPPGDGCLKKARALTQGPGGLGGTIEAGDDVGSALSLLPVTYDPENDEPSTGGEYLIGVPGENVGKIKDAGLVTTLFLEDTTQGLRLATHSIPYSSGVRTNLRYGTDLPLIDPTIHACPCDLGRL